jgi:hypothetical protein
MIEMNSHAEARDTKRNDDPVAMSELGARNDTLLLFFRADNHPTKRALCGRIILGSRR